MPLTLGTYEGGGGGGGGRGRVEGGLGVTLF